MTRGTLRLALLLPLLAAPLSFPAAAGAEPAPPGEKAAPAWKPLVGLDEWGGLYMAGQKCGWVHSTLKAEPRDGREVLVYRSQMTMKMKYQGVTAEMRVRESQEFDSETGAFRTLDRTMETVVPGLPAPIVVRAKVLPDGEALKCSLTVGARTTENTLTGCRYNLEAVLAAQLLAIRPGVKEGDRLDSEMPLVESNKAVRIVSEVRGRKTMNFRGVPTEVVEVRQELFELPPPGEAAPAGKPPMARMTSRIDSRGRPIEGDLL
ncbi:MAG TPA: hypothetical protein PK280_09265, partial [Planctomycetota bacterium]|nr:hypothetical protein [Planctomycetota bacterium]